MFIVWRHKSLRSDRRAALLADPPGGSSPWKPLYCDHGGGGRVSSTPLIMLAERVGGRPRQRLLRRLPGVRSCCVADPFFRAAWWHEIGDLLAHMRDPHEGDLALFLARDRRAILARLREVVPPPSREGGRDFRAYREARERDRWRGDVLAGAPWHVVLGVAPFDATAAEAAKSFRGLAKLHHPDRGGDTDLFARINAAYTEALEACAMPKAERFRMAFG